MRNFIGLAWLPALILCDPSAARAAPTNAEVTYVITNGGADVKGEGEAHFFAHGHHNGPTIDWARSGGAAHIPAGSYDVHITFMDGMNAEYAKDHAALEAKRMEG